MGPMQLVISGLLTLIVYGIALFAVYRIFQISKDVAEIKEMVREIKRNTQDAPVARVAESTPQSAEALVRAVHESYNTLRED